jgi:hypothetical protein
MSPTIAFLSDVGLAAITSVGIVVYLKKYLRLLLIELCGTGGTSKFLAGVLECHARSRAGDLRARLQAGTRAGQEPRSGDGCATQVRTNWIRHNAQHSGNCDVSIHPTEQN